VNDLLAASNGGRLVILGLGLIGGSLAKALKQKNAVTEVVGWGHRAQSLQKGVELGIIDRYSLDLADAVKNADIIVIATPTLIAETMIEKLVPLVPATTVITDVASVKGNLLRTARRAFGEEPANLVLAHPIAGSEQSGVAAAKADLFVNHRVIITPTARTSNEALALVEAMWKLTGAELSRLGVDEHDAILAATSHLPHIAAFALVDAFAGDPAQREIFKYAAGGFRDFTRIASSDPVMWRDIALANSAELLKAIDRFSEHLSQLREAIATGEGDKLLTIFTRAKQARDQFAESLRQRAAHSGDE
jgi:cyclohexadieny/prephenate dehydrogenase